MRSEDLLDILLDKVRKDWNSDRSMLQFYMFNTWRGGWEAWLQTSYAKRIFYTNNSRITQFDREVLFPGTFLKCDLWLQGGTGIWIELKTQRNRDYTNTVNDFKDDIEKLLSLDRQFRNDNVLVAAALFRLGTHAGVRDVVALNSLRSRRPAGRLHYLVLRGDNWEDVTEHIITQLDGQFMCATFVPQP